MYKNRFVVYFKGVRGSYPVPDKNFLVYGGNTSCIYAAVNNHRIILDAGSGIINAGKQITEEKILKQDKTPINVTILLSHLHIDHIQGLPFFSPLHIQGSKINLFGPSQSDDELKQNISSVIFNKVFPLSVEEIKSEFNINAINSKNNDFAIILKDNEQSPIRKRLSEIKEFEVTNNDVLITTLLSKTHPKDGVIIYKISYNGKSLVYATDKEGYVGGDKALSSFARDADLLIHDSQYTEIDYNSISNTKQGFGHSTYEMAMKEKENSHAKNLAFFHYDPNYDDKKLDEIKNSIINTTEGLIMPQENMEFVIL